MENYPNIPEKFLKPYDPGSVESAMYKRWEDSGFFNPDNCVKAGLTAPDAKPFTIMMPPPNVTGVLHMGHAMMLTLEDVMIRFKRMQGYRTLWLPGTDHAAIATQSKVEKEIQKKEGKSRHDLGREELLNRVRAFAQDSHDTIVSQVKVMGASCDWSREAFTLDATRNRAVNTMFKKMYDDGLIYRGHRIVNWDPKGQTTIADDEIVYEERKAKLYTFKYSKDFPIAISTTRPETKVGDTAVAVHPEDPRYKELIGKEYDVDFIGGTKLHIKIIADEGIEKEFGTGALGVTPAHSPIDWEMAEKNNLPVIQVINEYGKMTVGGETVVGKKVAEAREVIVAWLKEQDLLIEEKEISQNVPTAERTGGVIEPLPKLQWFVDVNKEFELPHSNLTGIPSGSKTTLKEIMRKTVESGQIKIMPDYFNKTYFHWIDNLRDWCISRQIWYGHRVPVWYDSEKKLHLPKKITLLLARHGESAANRDNVFSGGGLDSPLTELGEKQAKKLGENVQHIKLDGIISSGMIRGKETARIAAETIGFDTSKIIEINELHEVISERDGKPKTEEWPTLSSLVRAGRGETTDQITQRAEAAVQKISKLPEGTYLVCAHNAFNACLQAHIMGLTGEKIIDHWEKLGIRENGSYLEVTLMVNPEGDLKQDEDTLDTWFSSALWTFSTLGWPDKTKDLEVFHPTDVLETGYEILFFWVARMILMTGYGLGEIPFHTVYLHGTVRDGQGRKMSKSLGNGIDPLDIAAKYGADAGRMALVVGTAAGTDSKISEDKIKGYKNFANKLWNITRFILSSTENIALDPSFTAWTEADAKIHAEFVAFKTEITKEFEEYKFHLVSEKLYQYAWHTLADVLLEESKTIFAEGNDAAKASRAQLLLHTLYDLLKLLHPLMPFVTEEIWSSLPGNDGRLLMVTKWPSHES